VRLNWLKLYRYSHVVVYQAYAGLRNEIARTYIGVLWWLLEPTLNALTMYLVFGMLLSGTRRPDYLPFLLVGTFTWQWFAGSVVGAAGSIIAKAGLMQQVYLPKIIFPVVSVLNNTWKFLFAFVVLILVVSLSHAAPRWSYAALPFVLFTQFLLNLAIGIPLAGWIPYFRDGSSVISAVLTLLGFVSGIFFSPSQVPVQYRFAMEMNPMTIIMTAYRDIMLDSHWPNWPPLIAVAAGSTAVILAGVVLLDRLDLSLPKVSA
jgi:lipopolysaccharide transport system permease protein